MPPLLIIHLRGIKDKRKQTELRYELVFTTDRIAWNPDEHSILVYKDGEEVIFPDLTYARVSDSSGYEHLLWEDAYVGIDA